MARIDCRKSLFDTDPTDIMCSYIIDSERATFVRSETWTESESPAYWGLFWMCEVSGYVR